MTVALFAVAIFAFACKPARRAAPPSMPIALPDDWTPGGPYAGRITCLFAEGENLFAGGWHTGVFRSADGRNWTPFNDGMTGNRDVLALAGDGRALYAATLAGELFTNENGAWRIVREFGPGRRGALRALAYADGALIVGAGDGVHLTRDGGRSWRQIWSGADVTSLAVAPFSPGRLFFGTAGSGVGSCAADGADCRLAGAFPGGKSIVACMPARPSCSPSPRATAFSRRATAARLRASICGAAKSIRSRFSSTAIASPSRCRARDCGSLRAPGRAPAACFAFRGR